MDAGERSGPHGAGRDGALAVAEAALREGAPRYDVLAVRYGTRLTTRGDVYEAEPPPGDPSAPLRMDYFFWLLRGEAGVVLVDTGFAPVVGERRGRTTTVAPVEALTRLGLPAAAVRRIVLTHLHYDHTGHVRCFPGAELVVQRRELEFWRDHTGEHAVHVERDDVAAVAARARLTLLDGHALVAPGVGAVLVPGHSPGQTALVVNGRHRPVLLASDAVHYYEELERRLTFAIHSDRDAMVAGHDLVAAVAKRTGAVVVPGHDPEVTVRFPAVPSDPAGIAFDVSAAG